jgi:hypothetical protein
VYSFCFNLPDFPVPSTFVEVPHVASFSTIPPPPASEHPGGKHQLLKDTCESPTSIGKADSPYR